VVRVKETVELPLISSGNDATALPNRIIPEAVVAEEDDNDSSITSYQAMVTKHTCDFSSHMSFPIYVARMNYQ